MRLVLAIASAVLAAALTACSSAPPSHDDAPAPRSDVAAKLRPTTNDYRRYMQETKRIIPGIY